MTSVLAIGYGRGLFDKKSGERKRLSACAEVVDTLRVIVFSQKKHHCAEMRDGKLFLYPTDSRSRVQMLFDAYRIGDSLLCAAGAGKNEWIISAQDPFEAGLVGYALHLRHGVPLQVQEHGDFFGGSWWRNKSLLNRMRYVFGKWLLRRARCVRAVSKRVAGHLVAIGVDPLKIVTLAVASDVSAYRQKNVGDDGHNLHIQYPDAEAIVLTVGRLVREKNIASLIRAFGQVVVQYPKTRLVVLGSGPEGAALVRLAHASGLSGMVSFIPWTDDVASYMRSADIFVLCSYREGWSRVILEAMAAGLPGVVTDVGCVGEAFIDGRHGIVVPVDDTKALQIALERLLSDAHVRGEYGGNALQDSAAFATEESQYAQAWLATISVCNGKGRRDTEKVS